MVLDKRSQSIMNIDTTAHHVEGGCLFTLMTGRRPVSRRNRASWYLRHLNKLAACDPFETLEEVDEISKQTQGQNETNSEQESDQSLPSENISLQVQLESDDIKLVSVIPSNINQTPSNSSLSTTTSEAVSDNLNDARRTECKETSSETKFLVTPNSRVLFLSRSIATTIILDLSPSVAAVCPHNDCVFLDSMFDALKKLLHLLVKDLEIPGVTNETNQSFVLKPKVFVTVIAYSPFVVAKNNQVLVQNRRISSVNIDQVLVETWIYLNRLTQEVQELVSNTCGMNLDFEGSKPAVDNNAFLFPQPVNGVIRHPGEVLEDMFELGLFSSSLMPRLARLSMLIISDGLFSSANTNSTFRLKNIAVSFVSLGLDATHPDANFGYTPYTDLMKFTARTTQGVHFSHSQLTESSRDIMRKRRIRFLDNPLYKLFCWTLQDGDKEKQICPSPPQTAVSQKFDMHPDITGIDSDHVAKFFCVDQPADSLAPTLDQVGTNLSASSHRYHDWRSFKQLERDLDADFEQVFACLLREGYLVKSIHFKHKEQSKIVARLVLHWKHNLDLERELSAPYWSNANSFEIGDNNRPILMRPLKTPLFGSTHSEVIVHGSYSFLHNLYCDRRSRRRSEYRDISYRQFKQLIDGVMQTDERLQYLSRFYQDPSLSKVPSFLLHGNSLLYEQPHTHKLTSTVENVLDEAKTNEFQEYWQKISCLDTRSWKNLMHIHTLRLILEHDQPKFKNIQYQNANGRFTHVQCRRALGSVSTFIRSYASFALLEDTTYIKFIDNKDFDLGGFESSATKGFIVIRIHKLLPIIVLYVMFTSGIPDTTRSQIVSYLEERLVNCKLRNARSSTVQIENILRSKTIAPSSEMCCLLVKSPLERMLKVYGRNFLTDYLIHNWSYGLPGSFPYNAHRAPKPSDLGTPSKPRSEPAHEQQVEGYTSETSLNQYNLVFGKYLYGIRVIQTISHLPQDIAHSLAANTISKISSVLVNMRIKQGFHIAFNNSGILNLIVELAMKDHSTFNHSSNCLVQYISFPPTITNNAQQSIQSMLATKPADANSSKPCSLNGSLTNSESYMKNAQEVPAQHLRVETSDIKIIKEYWIEQQYGLSASSSGYHESLVGKRYSEIVDHLFTTDLSTFEFLFTYDLLQLMCDKLSPYHDLDLTLSMQEQKPTQILSPTASIHSSHLVDHFVVEPVLPSALIEGTTRDNNPKVPLLEFDYKFSITKFLDQCQQASLNVLLFKDHSEFYHPGSGENRNCKAGLFPERDTKALTTNLDTPASLDNHNQLFSGSIKPLHQLRQMSVDVGDLETEHMRREHRSSYQFDNHNQGSSSNFMNLLCPTSLNQIFLDTLHKRLKQMHDKELKLSEEDIQSLPGYLKRRNVTTRKNSDESQDSVILNVDPEAADPDNNDATKGENSANEAGINEPVIGWRCFLRKGNQENLMIVFIPSNLDDIKKWLRFVNSPRTSNRPRSPAKTEINECDPVCPIFVFRCSSSIIIDHVLSFLKTADSDSKSVGSSDLVADMTLHFGQPCKYMGQLVVSNDELNHEILPLIRPGLLNQTTSDEKTLEIVHFRAFLRKIKNTVLKSRFSSLNDAYLSELFIHRDDILYYLNNVDLETQKKYQVSSQLRGLADFTKNYEDYTESLPSEPVKNCNQLLNSILLQKCGLFINQPIARFNESNPLMKQLHDKKLLHFMRCNYKIELPILEENLGGSSLLRSFLRSSGNLNNTPNSSVSIPNKAPEPAATSTGNLSDSINESIICDEIPPAAASSTSRADGLTRLLDLKFASGGAASSPGTSSFAERHPNKMPPQARFGSNSTVCSLTNSSPSDGLILEAFRGARSCSMKEVPRSILDDPDDIGLRHEAHLAEVLRQTSERKESQHYRRVLKSKSHYNQSHSAIDQALRRVDSLGRLEHFCLTPLLFSPSWRSKLAPVRDHTIDSTRSRDSDNNLGGSGDLTASNSKDVSSRMIRGADGQHRIISDQSVSEQADSDERWHQAVCNNYIKEYEQYIQTLGFNSVQIRYPANSSNKVGVGGHQSISGANKPHSGLSRGSRNHQNLANNQSGSYSSSRKLKDQTNNGSGPLYQRPLSQQQQSRRESIAASSSLLPGSSSSSTCNTGYLIKFLNSGCLVFKVGFCKPYVYSILYSIEGERFNNSNIKMNMTTFLDELDNIKVTMHLHSFTYDYHLRSIYSYISGRQLTFSPGYHLVSFLDDFRKYYQKAPNYARNHILCGEVSVANIKVSGQQLYNYIVTHNRAYNMEILEMSSSLFDLTSRTLMGDQQKLDGSSHAGDSLNADQFSDPDQQQPKSPANNYVLIELKRDKVRYKDVRDPDIFDCGLLITHDFQQLQTNAGGKNSLTLKYFLLLTNQRDLYPKLIHTYDSIISSGCHRPIRLGVTQIHNKQAPTSLPIPSPNNIHCSIGQSDTEDLQSSELQSSGEMSGPQSINSTGRSVESCSSGTHFGGERAPRAQMQVVDPSVQNPSALRQVVPRIRLDESLSETPVAAEEVLPRSSLEGSLDLADRAVQSASSVEEKTSHLEDGNTSPSLQRRRRNDSNTSSISKRNTAGGPLGNERTICDEEITYLGYFSSEEMDMLRFLQEKTTNLQVHIEQVVRQAEVHYRRDYLWHKLMQRQSLNNKTDEIPLSVEELMQLLGIVEAIDLASLDAQLSVFTTMHINWYTKLLKAFADLKQSTINFHRIYTVKTSKLLLVYIDPKCMTAFILLSIDPERYSVELNLMLKNKQECTSKGANSGSPSADKQNSPSSPKRQPPPPGSFELDSDCQQLINDFINFCATFMWSTFLAGA